MQTRHTFQFCQLKTLRKRISRAKQKEDSSLYGYIVSVSQQPPFAESHPTSTMAKLRDRPLRTRNKLTHTTFVLLCIIGSITIISPNPTWAQGCYVSSQAATTLSQHIELDVTCPNAPFFKISESPDYKESAETGVVVTIDRIGPKGQYADVSIKYPNSTIEGNAIPFAVTDTTREVRILGVLFNFNDGALEPPSYATPAWVEKLVFDGNHDGRGLANSLRAHIEQNTYGTVTITGEVYPNWVEVSSIETYRDLNLSTTPDRKFAQEIVQTLLEKDPGFFAGKDFDFLIALTPGALMATMLREYQLYSEWPDPYGIFEGWAMFDIPVESNSQVYNTIYNEWRTSTTDRIVVPRYNPSTVEGVWLADDVAHTGINYFTGGRVRYDLNNSNLFAHFIELGTALPSSNTEVSITYLPRAYVRLTDEQMALVPPDTMPETRNFGVMVHELYHGMGWLLTPGGQGIFDLYQVPQELIEPYDLMSDGNWNNYKIGDIRYYVPGNLSAYSKVKLGLVHPYTLRYGENTINVRLYKAEEGDFTETNSRIKAIKVPLHPVAEIGYWQLVEYPDVDTTFGGEEYLLLEWRHTGELENGAYNFDEALPYEGLLIYRVVEGDPNSRHGDDYQNVVRIADATPAFDAFPFDDWLAFWMEDVFSLDASAAPFGYASGVYSYVAAAPWNWKAGTTTTSDFQLSPGYGEKTIYAKFMDLNGQIVGENTLLVKVNALPVADAGSDQTFYEEVAGQGALVVLDGTGSSDPNGTVVGFAWYEGSLLLATGETAEVNLDVGLHSITLVVYDDQGATGSDDVLVTIKAANIPPIADAGPDATVIDTDGDGFETVNLNGVDCRDPDGSIVKYEWYEGTTLLASGSTATINLSVGRHSLTLKVTDDRGAASTDALLVDVIEGSVTAPSNLQAAVTKTEVRLTWSDNSANEAGFYVERGEKVKREVRYVQVGTVEPNTTQYTTTLASGTYYFRVRAFGASGSVSAYSNPVIVSISVKVRSK